MFKAMSPLLIPHICVVLCLAYLGLVPAHAHSEDTATATHGMMIDAGTEGSRVHVFSWDNRVFRHFPIPLTIPENHQILTTRLRPGIDSFVHVATELVESNHQHPSNAKHSLSHKLSLSHLHGVKMDMSGLEEHLTYLLTFAKNQLLQYKESWSTFPIYLRATGGVRALPPAARTLLMASIRVLLSNSSFCPFYFQFDAARMLSGEEQAVFAWTAANYLHDRLLPDMTAAAASPSSPESSSESSASHGAIVDPERITFGTLDLGATSSQLAFYAPSQDISEGLFKLQLGMFEHWNLYAKSFLGFGYNVARLRHLQELAQQTISQMDQPTQAVVPRALDYCFFAGYSEGVQVDAVTAASDKNKDKQGVSVSMSVEVHGPAVPAGDQLQRCTDSLRGLLPTDTEGNAFCNEVYSGECSMNGAYQPPLPQGGTADGAGHFVGTSTYQYPWQFLQMPAVGTLPQFKEAAANICSKSFNDIVLYDAALTYIKTPKHSSLLPYYCFLSSYIVVLLEDGYGFTSNNTFSAQGEVKGNQVGWAYGAMLYEVNSLPFRLEEPDEIRLLGRLMLAWSCGVVAGVIVVGGVLSQFLYRPNQRPSSQERRGGGREDDEERGATHTQGPADPAAASSFYHDLAKIYHGSGGSGGGGSGGSSRRISQYSPFANQTRGPDTDRGTDTDRREASALLGTTHGRGRQSGSRGTGSVDSNSSTDTISVLKSNGKGTNNNNYQSI